jgi:hypothetical protein
MLLARRDVIRKQDEALADLQERNALGRIARLFGGICASVCLIQILAQRAHFSGSAVLLRRNAEEESRFHDSAVLEPRGEETE